MHPILFQIGPITIYSYGVMIALAVILCAWLLSRDAKVYKIPADTIYDLMFWTVAWGILGARIFYIGLTWNYFSKNLLEMIMLQHGGLAWQGGFIGGALAGTWFVINKKLPLRLLLDLVAPYIALGQSIGRVGCFFNGCCYGKPVSWGIYFPVHEARLHPTQLYETGGLLVAFFILKYAQTKPHRLGMIFVLYLWLGAIERFTVEFFRADHDGVWLGLSLFQYISLAIFAVGLVLLRRFRQ
ncbi:MAG: prolipoprotein diacylglyceryl transferase [Candidatus Omnitrophica bacterium]|nr:prolipoprotein diacylglyceryl transferase [Candidatus Omnitrophota bacterium]